MLSDVYVVLLSDLTLEDHKESIGFAACLCDDLTVKIELQLTLTIEMSCFLVF